MAERIIIGEVIEGKYDPSARIVPTAEWISPYEDLSDQDKEAIMREVEPPRVPRVE